MAFPASFASYLDTGTIGFVALAAAIVVAVAVAVTAESADLW
jgi:hypothetical protein